MRKLHRETSFVLSAIVNYHLPDQRVQLEPTISKTNLFFVGTHSGKPGHVVPFEIGEYQKDGLNKFCGALGEPTLCLLVLMRGIADSQGPIPDLACVKQFDRMTTFLESLAVE